MRAAKKILGLVVLLLALGLGVICVLHRHRVQPEPPPRGATTQVPPEFTSESSLSVPVFIDTAVIASIAEAKLPQLLMARTGVQAAPGVTADLRVHRLGAVTVTAHDGAIRLRVPVAADITARWRPQPWLRTAPWGRKPELRLHPTFIIEAELRIDVDADWNLATATEATLRWEQDPIVPVGPIGVPLSSLVGDQVHERFTETARTIDEQVRARVPLRRVVLDAWNATFQVLAIGARQDLWLALRPTGLYMGDIAVRDGKVVLDAGVRGRFRIVVGERPMPAEPTPLPARSAPPDDPGIALELPVVITFAAANRELDEHTEGLTIDPQIPGIEATVTIDAIDVYPSGQRVAVALEFSADLRGQLFDVEGTMYLVGTPTLDPSRNELRISALAYDAQTNRALLDVAEWMLHAAILRELERRLVFRFADRLDRVRAEIDDRLADAQLSPALRLRGELTEVKVVALTITDTAVVALTRLRGAASIQVESTP